MDQIAAAAGGERLPFFDADDGDREQQTLSRCAKSAGRRDLHPGKYVNRRTLLRGLGTAIALPLLDAMVPAFTRAATSKAAPCRMALLYVPNGIMMNQWIPTAQPRALRRLPGAVAARLVGARAVSQRRDDPGRAHAEWRTRAGRRPRRPWPRRARAI